VIIGVDTLRSDHLGCYGYERETTPNIDRFASGGTLFENVYSQSPWTLPSFATVFTSLYPSQHGAGSLETRMRTSFPPLAMILLKNGYSTGAIINAPALKRQFGINRGFEFYDVNPPGVERRAETVTEDALAWIDANSDGPFFAFVHYFDPHLSYSPPQPFDTRFDPDYSGRIGRAFDLTEFPGTRTNNFEELRVLTDADWNHIVSLYDGEIAYTDQAVAALIEGLEERGLRDNTLLVFLSDHGEEFFEHEGFEHGHTLYNELLKVPLILSLPGVIPQGKRIEQPVRLLDVMPTALDVMGIPPGTHVEGVSLEPLIAGKELSGTRSSLHPHHVSFAEAMLHGPEQKSLISHPWKLIYTMHSGERSLFNLDADPGETENLIGSESEIREALDEVLYRTLFALSKTWYIEIAGDEETVFDIDVEARRRPMAGRIGLHALFDEGGMITECAQDPLKDDHILSYRNLSVSGPVTIAFQASPDRVTVEFDVRIDGEPVPDLVYLGDSLGHPEGVPFTFARESGHCHSSRTRWATLRECPSPSADSAERILTASLPNALSHRISWCGTPGNRGGTFGPPD
jgi:arylsulfatase A-like enzyme